MAKHGNRSLQSRSRSSPLNPSGLGPDEYGDSTSPPRKEDVGAVEPVVPPPIADLEQKRETSRKAIVFGILAAIMLTQAAMFCFSPQADATDTAKSVVATLLGALGTAIGFYFTRNR